MIKKTKVLNFNTGFTLVEIMVAIAIVAILAMVGLVIFSNVTRGARDSKRKQDLNAISKALYQYYLQYGRYPAPRPSSGVVSNDPTVSPCGWGPRSSSTNAPSCGGDQWLTDDPNFAQFMPIIPRDPSNDRSTGTYAEDHGLTYTYWTSATGNTFDLLARLENEDDPQSCKNVGYWVESRGGRGANISWCINTTGGTSWWSNASAEWLYVVHPQITD